MTRLQRLLPILGWARDYRGETFASDAIAATIVTIMLIPQSLAYAMLAGLPPEVGLYASILPLIAYALFGTSKTLAVGPVAIVSLMTAAAAGQIASSGTPLYIEAALVLAILSGGLLLAAGLFRLGFLANFLSHPVISGFITASGIVIALSQIKHILGIDAHGHTVFTIIGSLALNVRETNPITVIIGSMALIFLFLAKAYAQPLARRIGMPGRVAVIASRTAPVIVVVSSIVAVSIWQLDVRGVRILQDIPRSLPGLQLPTFNPELWSVLVGAAALISLIGFVESVSVAQTLAARRRQRVDPNQELVALGTANLASGVSMGYPVTGGLARSAVNFDAGAQTPAAGAYTAVGIALASLFLTPYLYYLPQAVLGATIIVAVLSLVDLRTIREVWRYSKSDFAAMACTIAITLTIGVEQGVVSGVGLSLLLHLYNTSRPHFAIVGQVPGTEHFRNVLRHEVVTSPTVLTIRVDESLYFANARFLEDVVHNELANRKELEHVVLMCPAVNRIDASGLESLESIHHRLKEAGVTLHLSEVKGPVMDRLRSTDFLRHLSGKVFLHQFEAMSVLAPDTIHTAQDIQKASAFCEIA